MTAILFDTSVLVAASVAGHPHHARASVWVEAARKGRLEMRIASHGLAETWATLTAMPLEPRLSGEQAERIVSSLAALGKVVDTGRTATRAAIARCAARGLRSAAIHDALHVEAIGADGVVLTFNAKDFERLTDDDVRVIVPPDPPRVTVR